MLILSLSSLVPPGQVAPAVVTPDQDSYTIAAGAATTVTIRLEDATNVYGVDVRASFDPALVEVVDVDATTEGVQIEPGQFPKPDFVAVNRVDPQAGTLRYVITQVNPTPPASGDGIIFSVRLRGLGVAGAGEFRIELVEMSDRNGQLLPVEIRSATLDVMGSDAGQAEAAPTGVAVAPTAVQPTVVATAVATASATPMVEPTGFSATVTDAAVATATDTPAQVNPTATMSAPATDGSEAAGNESTQSPASGEIPAAGEPTSLSQDSDSVDLARLPESTSTPTDSAGIVASDTRSSTGSEPIDSVADEEVIAAMATADFAVIGESAVVNDGEVTTTARPQEGAPSPVIPALAVAGLLILIASAVVLLIRRTS